MSVYLNTLEKEKIKNKIEAIEAKSSAEIAVAVTGHAKNFGYLTFIYALVFTLPFALIYMVLGYEIWSLFFVEIVIGTYLFAYFILSSTSLMSQIVPKTLRQKRCEELAFGQFYKSGIDRTSNHKAILIFVCLKSRYIRIIADAKIDETVPEGTWQKAVQSFIDRAKEDGVAEGILEIVQSCGDILIKNFPRDASSKDELSNEVIEI